MVNLGPCFKEELGHLEKIEVGKTSILFHLIQEIRVEFQAYVVLCDIQVSWITIGLLHFPVSHWSLPHPHTLGFASEERIRMKFGCGVPSGKIIPSRHQIVYIGFCGEDGECGPMCSGGITIEK